METSMLTIGRECEHHAHNHLIPNRNTMLFFQKKIDNILESRAVEALQEFLTSP